ncbi:hypothetical protein CALVIDRAFT_596761 [Calocera viscosa TUFC12733]|uniref:Uncharacterized protein n=1 Tax=Calocera viscosa (strain TUFC12733) TaxID=1330018 RepID=A0A167PDP1_CALVF|nr:hypothetical protein CALVIDRAFT_596761 [Calocera viscosa TUFC12733]
MTTLDAYPMLPSQPPARRLSARRSSAAQDPFGRLTLTAAQQPDSVSRLTLVRVPQSTASEDGTSSRPNSALGSRPGSAAGSYRDTGRELGRAGSERRHERAHSGDGRDSDRGRRSSWGSASGEGSARGRMSFAFSSFTPIHPPASSVPERGPLSAGPTPTSPMPGTSPGSGTGFAGSFGHQRARTASTASSGGPPRTKQTLTPQQTVDLALSTTAHAAAGDEEYETPTIAELGEQDYLPFLDRCGEVQQLISTPGPTCDLFKLLRQTFPAPSPSTRARPLLPLPEPTKWTYAQLQYHLTSVPREQCPDAEWSRMLRICIRAHSEALWERVKGALGIPPELEVEDARDDPSQAWELYDFGPGADADPADLFGEEDVSNEDYEPAFGARLEPVYHGDTSPLLSPTVEAALSPNLNALSSSISSSMMPELAELREEEELEEEEDHLSASVSRSRSRSPSPVGSTKSGTSNTSRHIHGLRITTASVSGGSSLSATPPSLTPAGSAQGANLTRAFSTGSIRQGLARLKMTPMSPPSPVAAVDQAQQGHTRARASLGVPGEHGRPRGATVNIASLPGQGAAPSVTFAEPVPAPVPVPESPVRRRVSSGGGSGAYHPLAERGPGNPLFPSSFSRLSMSPTLSANNPALRNALDAHPSAAAYAFNGRRRHNRAPSWAEGMMEGRNSGEFEYAVTVASGSSVYGD